jgi:hypothetical protein
MQRRLVYLGFFLAGSLLFGQADKPADNTKIFGAPPPTKKDKTLFRSVIGSVKDVDGNPVPGALVYLKDVKSGKERSIAAGPTGTYRFDDLNKGGDYKLWAAKDKAASISKTLSTFDTRVQPVMNLTLEPKPAIASTPEKK